MASNADSPTAAAKVSLATPDDIPELIHIFWEAFSGPAESTFPQTDDGRAWLERSFQNFLGKQSYYRPESKVPVVRNANGRVLSFAVTHIVKLGQTVVGNSWKRRWSAAEDLPGVSEERLASYFETLAEAHHLTVGNEGHVYIEFLMTKSTSRHKGYATAIVDWITKLADDLDYACYLDGGGRGMGILERAGFVAKDIGHKYNDTPPPCVPMLRVKNKRGW
ncbi:hypothetical protein NUW58_g946 [Xylaria curta]|uniref:Uncharacterized protein n=1 Tax=Xylaria curta TaxID=42375 RepID=A0ACC1PMV7_9PEZI|nr:hypothetical protein NUW58_g946 [Xylaria curta]